MPEHRAETPPAYRLLESFLWHDFDNDEVSWQAWLEHRGLASNACDALSALELHGALRDLQEANGAEEQDAQRQEVARTALNRLADTRALKLAIRADGAVVVTAHQENNPVDQVLIEAFEAMRSGVWRRFKRCRDNRCRASFYDASKASGKIWCDMATCGSQNKMRRYRSKQG